MIRARFRFHGELNTFLLPAQRHRAFDHIAGSTDTLKHVIESLGVPHTEIGRIEVDGIAKVDADVIADGVSIDVWPVEIPIHVVDPRFVLDGHLGRLAAYLRMLGFDVAYDRFADDSELARVSRTEDRILLTRDVGLLKRKEVTRGGFVRADKPQDQLREAIQRFGLGGRVAPFTRCMSCNGELEPVAKADVEDKLPPHTRLTKNEFKRCPRCGKVYWKGSHQAAMLERVRAVVPD